ncbi:MAG: IclR family transcriptional regulator [Desulfobacteraceae bacterium]|nr:IclR family transcriptional regulator [Desulfobacteraceae bacterium]
MPARGEKYFFINSLAKGIRVLELLAEKQALTVSEVARHLELNRAGSHRFLATLRELGYVDKDEDGRYHLTFRVLELGMAVANRFEIHRIVRPYLQELSLAFNETVNLGHFDGGDILHLDKIDSKEILRMDSPIGSRAPAYCTALGKAVLAFLPEEEFEKFLKQVRCKAFGPNTITSRRGLRAEIQKVRRRGYAVDDEEMASGLRCVAAPVFDHTGGCRYAISVSGPSFRLTPERIETIQPRLRDICRRISGKLGSTAPCVADGPITH